MLFSFFHSVFSCIQLHSAHSYYLNIQKYFIQFCQIPHSTWSSGLELRVCEPTFNPFPNFLKLYALAIWPENYSYWQSLLIDITDKQLRSSIGNANLKYISIYPIPLSKHKIWQPVLLTLSLRHKSYPCLPPEKGKRWLTLKKNDG